MVSENTFDFNPTGFVRFLHYLFLALAVFGVITIGYFIYNVIVSSEGTSAMKVIFLGFAVAPIFGIYIMFNKVLIPHAIRSIYIGESSIIFNAWVGPFKSKGEILISDITGLELRKTYVFKLYGKFGYIIVKSGIKTWSLGSNLSKHELEELNSRLKALVNNSKAN